MLHHLNSERGQGLVEYALIIIFIAIVVTIALTTVPPGLVTVFNDIGITLESIIN
jgi:Flp pilus assembly pilin Flp